MAKMPKDEAKTPKDKTDKQSDRNIVNQRLIYGRRQGHRLHPNQARLVADLLPSLRPDFTKQGPAGWFEGDWFDGVKQDYALEIGFGGGEHLAARAKAAPDIGFIGCEPFLNGVAKLLLAIIEASEADNLRNIIVHDDDARDVLDALPDASLGTIYLLYPDPWPKKRHHKRRFISAANLQQIFRVLRPGGAFLVASDIADYLNWTLIHMKAHGGFDWAATQSEDWQCAPKDWPGTRYEAKAKAAGRKLGYLVFSRRTHRQPATL